MLVEMLVESDGGRVSPVSGTPPAMATDIDFYWVRIQCGIADV
jgi:hypothetical protein